MTDLYLLRLTTTRVGCGAPVVTPTEIRLRAAIVSLLGCSYRTDRGEEIKGNAISALSSDLRDRGWRGVSNLNDLESTVEALGFKMVKAQMTGAGWKKAGRFARVVTFDRPLEKVLVDVAAALTKA